MRTLLRTLAPLALVLAVAGCREAEDATFEPVTDAAGNTVTLEAAGAEPRQELRIGASAGDVDEVTQLQETSMEMSMGGRTQSVTGPAVELDLRYSVDDVTEDRINVTGSYVDVRVDESGDPQAAAQMRQSLAELRSATAHIALHPRGSITEARMEGLDMPGVAGQIAEQLTSSMAENAQNLSIPFPVEAVGVGARWRVEATTEIGGLPIELTTVIELTDLDEDRAAGAIEQTLRFVPGEVDVFGTPANVVSGELAGTGTVEWDLGDGIVPRSDITTAGTTVLEVSGDRIEQHQDMRIAFVAR